MGVMAQGIAHEFNNLLAIILNNAELTLATLNQRTPERLSVEAIVSAGRQAAVITRQMQTYVGHNLLQTTLLSLNDLIEEMKELRVGHPERCTGLSPERCRSAGGRRRSAIAPVDPQPDDQCCRGDR